MLLALILVIALKSETFAFKTEEIIPTEKGKVENFITTCMDQIGEDALFKVGVQSGYIEVPEDIFKDGSKNLKISPMNVVPFWAIGPNTYVPSLDEIKEEIDTYMENNLRECLFGMEAFQEKYNLIEKSDITADTKIVESKVIFNVHWDVEIKNKAGEVVSEVINHLVESPVKLKRVYDTAVTILQKEMGDLKLEDIAQDLLALDHPNVPLTGIELKCSKKTWDVNKVEETLMKMLRINVRELKVQGTEYVDFPEELTYYQNHYIWDVGEEINDEVSVMFNFDETYPYVFAVTPLAGTKMKSSQLGGTDPINFLCIQTWKFTYDLVYPVLVRVRDETTNYEFNFAFTVHLIRNTPDKGDALARPSLIIPSVTADDYCKQANVPMTVRTVELIENGEGVSFYDDLGDVNVSFTCLRYKCDLGQTTYDYSGLGFAGFNTNFPYCVGGVLRGEKEGYKEDWERVVTRAGDTTELNLVPIIKVPLSKLKVVKHTSLGNNLGAATELSVDETALVKLTFAKTNETQNLLEHEVDAIISKGMDSQLIGGDELELLASADFTYYLEIMAFKDESFVGGYKGEVKIPWTQLKNANELTFHILSKETSNEGEMFEFMTNLEQLSKNIPALEIK